MKKTVTLNDKTFEVMIPAHEIDRAVAAVAECLNADYGDKERPIFVGVLNGAFMFLSDLIKKIDFTCEISFVKLASYEGTCSTGNVDIVDTGRSIAHMYADLMRRNPASVEVCTLFFKPNSYREPLPIRYRALEIGNEFIVGYGLDYDQLGRNLKDIYVVTND